MTLLRNGLCEDHRPHFHTSKTLGRFWCTADQSQRQPFKAERLRAARLGG